VFTEAGWTRWEDVDDAVLDGLVNGEEVLVLLLRTANEISGSGVDFSFG
jgi:hypothetical protein